MFLGHFQRYIKLPVVMTLLTTCPLSFPLPKPKWLPRFMRIDIWAVNILEPHLMSVSVRVNTFLAEDRCWSYLHWKCGAVACSLLPLQHLGHLPPPPRCCLLPEGELGAQAEQGLPGRLGLAELCEGPWVLMARGRSSPMLGSPVWQQRD